MQLEPVVIQSLAEIDFLQRFKKISVDYSNVNDTFEKWSKEHVELIFQELGYKSKYHKRENFFEIIQSTTSINCGMNISLKYGAVEFIPHFKKLNGTKLVGGPIKYIRQLLDVDEQINLPCFHDYKELTIILKSGFNIYDDLKQKLNDAFVI
jgi:hypothetical protein